ncbi:MAG TPA: wax ester/triacylglycerol synthase family O-acyltransferase [Acidimicrobiales bacterium]|nr:wax ester/triacylglycerol synthase family O-acyltransferase [Acidimicrobiales bacterium]
MTNTDAAFLYFETPTMHMHVVGVLVLDGSDVPGGFGMADVRAALEQRIHLIPPLRRRLVSPLAGMGHPVWIEDPDFSLDDHILPAPLPTPVSWHDLERFVGTVAARPLDRHRPLWEMWIVEGLEKSTIALVTKLHHSIMDGGAGGDLMASLFDLSPEIAQVTPEETPWQPDQVPSAALVAARSIASLPRYVWEAPRDLARTTWNLANTARTWAVQRAAGTAAPLTAPRTVLNGAVTANRSVSLTRVDLDDVREIRRAFDTTINDVVLAATATALRSYLEAHGAVPARPLIAAVPVNIRADGPNTADGELGNRVSNMMVSLELEPSDPVDRLRAVHAHAVASKALFSAFGPQSLELLTGFLPPTVATVAARLYTGLKLAGIHPPVFNLIVSNIPGPPVDLYIAGARVTGIFPMGPVMDGAALNLTVLSEAHHLNVGIMACPELVPAVEEVGAGFVSAIRDLTRRAQATPGRKKDAGPRRRSRPASG